MSSQTLAYPGPSGRTPVAAVEKSDGLLCILFDDSTVGVYLEGETLDGSGYQMVYHSPGEVTQTEHWRGRSLEITLPVLLLVIILPYTLLYASVRSYIQLDVISGQLLIVAMVLAIAMDRARVYFERADELHIHHSTNIDPYVVSLKSDAGRGLRSAIVFAFLFSFASFLIYDEELTNPLFCDALLLAFVAIATTRNWFTIPITQLFNNEGIIVPLLLPKDFCSRIERDIEAAKEELRGSRTLEDLVLDGENERVEFKSSFWTDKSGQRNLLLQDAVVKEVAGFLNSDFGGTLLIGINDMKPFNPSGMVEGDISEAGSEDRLELHIGQILSRDLGIHTALWKIRFPEFRGERIIRIDVPRKAPKPVMALQPNRQKKNGLDPKKEFAFSRSGSKTIPNSLQTWGDYVLLHWGRVSVDE